MQTLLKNSSFVWELLQSHIWRMGFSYMTEYSRISIYIIRKATYDFKINK
jgi:hypothetical protein